MLVLGESPFKPSVVGALLAAGEMRGVQRFDPSAREARVVQLRRLPRRAGVRVPIGVTGGVERREGDLVDPDVVGMRVELPIVGVGHDHLRTHGPDDADQPADGFVERRVGEVVGPGVHVGVGHARIVVAEHHQLVVADGVDTGPELL